MDADGPPKLQKKIALYFRLVMMYVHYLFLLGATAEVRVSEVR
jgi:hypothetical protein